jgi:hypothetical protein
LSCTALIKSARQRLPTGFPGPTICYATERGHKYAPEAFKKGIIRCPPDNGWQAFVDSFSRVRALKQVRTIVIDKVDDLYQWCCEYAMIRKHGPRGPKYPGDANDHGASWNACKVEFVKGMARLAHIAESKNATLLLICQSDYREIKGLVTDTVRINVALPGQAEKIVLSEPDHIWHLAFGGDEDERLLVIRGNADVHAGTRASHVTAKELVLKRKSNPRQYYLQIAKAYLKKEED